jgi:hypothetical protein
VSPCFVTDITKKGSTLERVLRGFGGRKGQPWRGFLERVRGKKGSTLERVLGEGSGERVLGP